MFNVDIPYIRDEESSLLPVGVSYNHRSDILRIHRSQQELLL